MKKINQLAKKTLVSLAILTAFGIPTAYLGAATPKELKVGVVNFKQCVEQSKIGKQEQTSFEALKKQAEQMMQEKEKELQNISAKIDDPDYFDGLSQEAQSELKHKYRMLTQQIAQNQQQLYQTLSQANFKIVQKLTESVNNASKEIAKKMDFDLVLNEDASFFYAPALDITKDIVKYLDEGADKNNSNNDYSL